MTGNGLSFSIQDNESGPPIKNTSGLARPDFFQFWYHHGSAAPNRPSLQARQSLSPCFAISRINCRVWRDSGATKKVASYFRRLASQPQRSSFIFHHYAIRRASADKIGPQIKMGGKPFIPNRLRPHAASNPPVQSE